MPDNDNTPAPLPYESDPPTQPGDTPTSGNGHGSEGDAYERPDDTEPVTPWRE